MKEFELNKGIAFEQREVSSGNNSACYVIKYRNDIMLLKILTSLNYEEYVVNKHIPRLIEKGIIEIDDERRAYQIYEYIDGVLLRNIDYVDKKLLSDIISFVCELHSKGYYLADINQDNFIYSRGTIYMVDLGAIIPLANPVRHVWHIVSNQPDDCDEMVYTEKLEIYYVGYMFKSKKIDNSITEIVNKMLEKSPDKRYESFEEIYLELKNIDVE